MRWRGVCEMEQVEMAMEDFALLIEEGSKTSLYAPNIVKRSIQHLLIVDVCSIRQILPH
jgi:hypothetical protein